MSRAEEDGGHGGEKKGDRKRREGRGKGGYVTSGVRGVAEGREEGERVGGGRLGGGGGQGSEIGRGSCRERV